MKTLLAAFFIFFFPLAAYAKPPNVSADAAILMDATTGQVFYAKNSDKQRYPASLTKIMTAIIALENGKLDDVVTISARAASVSEGQVIDLQPGEKITLRNLLKAALIYSANDSTVAIAEHIGGSEEKFIEMMNIKAVLLGAVNTRYANTNGYTHPNHYSTANDLALITRYALRNPLFKQFVCTKEAVVQWCGKRKMVIYNTNRLLREGYPGVDGVKTGSTARAGNCLIASSVQGSRRFITVVLHSDNRYLDTIKLLDYGFEQILSVSLCERGEVMGRLCVRGGVLPQVNVIAKDSVKVDILKDDIPGLKRKIILTKISKAPVRCRQKLGEAIFYLHKEELARVDLVTARTVAQKGWLLKLREKFFSKKMA